MQEELRCQDELVRDRIEQQLRDTIDAIPVLCGTLSSKGEVDFFNRRTLEYYGLTSDQMVGFNWKNWIHPDDLPRLLAVMSEGFAAGRSIEVETRNKRSGGEYRWMAHRIVPRHDEHGTIIKWYGTSFDIEDRKRAEEAVLEERVLERTRIARELHDTVLQTFHAALLILGTANKLLDEGPVKERLKQALESAHRATCEGRDAIQGLRPQARPDELIRSLHTLGESLAAVQVYGEAPDLHVEVSGLPVSLQSAVNHEVFKVGSEAIRNAFRHARARNVYVRFRYSIAEFVLTVIDDGAGIDPNVPNTDERRHFGLVGMRERATIVKGELALSSQVGQGTRVELKIPSTVAYASQ